ncbi:hypothetical protein ABBQ38_007532 [Trebouxia sp. C0009 RCD-2024]
MTLIAACWHQAHAARPFVHLLPVHPQQALISLRHWQPLSYTTANRSCCRRKTTHVVASSEAPEGGVSTGAAVIKTQLNDVSRRWKQMFQATDPTAQRTRLQTLEQQASTEGFWNEQEKAASVNQEMSEINETLQLTSALEAQIENVATAVELLEMEESDSKEEDSFKTEALHTLDKLTKALDQWETQQLLGGQYDKLGAILSIQAGAGGTDAQDWAEMLLRMYTRWAAKEGFTASVLSRAEGEGAGIKSAELEVQGRFAFGYLSTEKGTHRLVRQSPFNANATRQTSFAAVDVMPLLGEPQVKSIDIPEADLEVTTMRSGGAGGQHVNKTESAVRVKHIPTGLAVRCDQSRSQHMNKSKALELLKGRLLVIAQEQQLQEIKDIKGDAVKADWGQQIRNYVFHPYKMIKDVRSGFETSNVAAVMDGEALDGFIEAQLRHRSSNMAGTS